MTTELKGPTKWTGNRDEYGYRSYTVTFRVISNSSGDGPAQVLQTSGLPRPGDTWEIGNDFDPWAWCRPNCEITPVVSQEPNFWWDCTFNFSSKPPNKDNQRCADTEVEDPLLEPPKISGSFVKYTEEAWQDRFGRPIVNSAFEQIRGNQVEFDRNRATIHIEQNFAVLDLGLLSAFGNAVNMFPLWGLGRRCIKLSNANWERKFKGACEVYFTRILDFDVNYETFDKDVLDEGTKVLNGHWDNGSWILDNINGQPPNPKNPQHFIRFKDRHGENTRVILNGQGLPAGIMNPTGAMYICITTAISGQQPSTSPDFLKVTQYPPMPIAGADVALVDDPKFVGSLVVQPDGVVAITGMGGVGTLFPAGVQTRGIYDPTKTYYFGDIVQDTASTGEAGKIHVEKYNEADFTILGIPTVLE